VKVRLTRAGARLVRRRLGLDSVRAGTLGHLSARATVPAGGTGGDGGSGGGGAGRGGGQTPPACTPDYASGPIEPAPPAAARPAGAVDIAGATIAWRPRASFIQYVNSGEGATASDGATAAAPETAPGSSEPLVYAFGFELEPGSWYDPATGTAGVLAHGSVRFRYSGHGIDITVRDPEIALDGASSNAVFTLGGASCTDLDDVRGTMLDLIPGTPATNGATRDYGAIPARITATGSSMFSGFYLPGDAWGSIAVALTVAP
jgi:hypothetical protein